MKVDHPIGPLSEMDLQFPYSAKNASDLNFQSRGSDPISQVDRLKSDEVLNFVNGFANDHPEYGNAKDTALRAERFLKTLVPADITVHIDISSWIAGHWNRYTSI